MKFVLVRSLSKPARAALISAAAATLAPLVENIASAQPLPIYPGLAYDAATGNGYQTASFAGTIGTPVSSTGLAVGYANLFEGGVDKDTRAVLLNAAGSAIQLTGLTTDPSLAARSSVYTINASGKSVGFANKQFGGSDLGDRAVRWDAGGNVFELDTLGVDPAGFTKSYAYGINAAGQTVGSARKYVGGVYQGDSPVRWDAVTGAVTELGNIGLNGSGQAYGYVFAINSSGQMAGQMSKYSGNQYKGERAVAWSAAGTALELANLGLSNQSYTDTLAYGINSSGQIAGYATKYLSGLKGDRAVRWNATTGVATELANLGTDLGGTTYAYGFAINDAGQVAGRALKYVGGVYQGERAVRWNADGTALELGNLGLSATNQTTASAFAVNALGQTAGRSKAYVGGVDQGDRAVYWTANGTAVDLNTLISSSSNWTLTRARAISDNGWVTGFGMFDPDGTGALAAYQRHFLLNVATENSWLQSSGGAWATGGNWFTNFAPSSTVDALFNLNSGGGYTVNVNGTPAEAKNLIVKTDKVTLSIGGANTLALNSIVVGRDSGDVARLTTTGGTVTLAGALTIAETAGTTGTFILDGGTLNAASIVNKGTFQYNGGTINVPSVQLSGSGLMHLSPGGNKTLKVSTLGIADTSKLDLADGKLIVQSGGTGIGAWNGSNYTGTTGLLRAGRTVAGNWSGSGIVTSMTDATTSIARTLAIATAGQVGKTTFGGVSVSGDDVLVMYTFGGDANLDGRVNADDYFRIDSNFGKTADADKSFFNGDFNYDGAINADDYVMIDAGFSADQLSPAPTAGVNSVPEPASALTILSVALAARRRRRQDR
jgi:hypothetical protein